MNSTKQTGRPTFLLPSLKWLLKRIYSSIVRVFFYDIPHTVRAAAGKKDMLLVRTDGLGDLILAIPILKHIKEAYRGSYIVLLTREEWVSLFRECPYIDEIIPWNIRRYRASILCRIRFLRSLRKRNFKLAIHPVYSRESLSDEVFCCCRAAEKIGIDGDLNNIGPREKSMNNRYYSRLIEISDDVNSEIDRNRKFTESLIGKSIDPKEFQPELWPSGSDRAVAQGLLKQAGLDPLSDIIVAIFPGASWRGKQWASDSYAEIADRATEQYGAKIAVCGGETDLAAAVAVTSKMKARSVNLVGRVSLRELAAICESCCLFIGNDTGPLHIAVAMGTPTLCIMGGGHFGRFHPYGDPAKNRLVFKRMDCYNCNWKCIYKTVRCIEEIRVDDVWHETQKMMNTLILPGRKEGRTTINSIETPLPR